MTCRLLITSSSFGAATGRDRLARRLAEEGWAVEFGREICHDERLADFEAMIVGTDPVDEPLLDRARKLKVLVKYGVGFDNVDVEACTRRGILVGALPNVNRVAVAEFALALILSSARLVPRYAASVKAGEWNRPVGRSVCGKTLGIIGTGAIGRTLAGLCRGLNMRILGYDLVPTAAFVEECGGTYVSLDELLRESDFVSIHVPRTPETEGLLGKEQLALMKPGAFLINVSRGGIVDQAALADAILSRRLAGAALDVFDREPPELEPWLLDPAVIPTPHVAAYTEETLRAMDEEALATVRGLLGGDDLERAVNPDAVRHRSRTT